MVIIYSLVVLNFSFLIYIVPEKIKLILFIGTFIVTALYGLEYESSGILILIYTLGEYFLLRNKMEYSIIGILPLSFFMIHADKSLELIFMSLIILLIQLYIMKKEKRLISLEEQWDENRIKVMELNSKIVSMEKYKEQEIETLKLQERNELSGRVHDKVGHMLSGAILQIEALGIVIKNDNNEKALEIVENVSKLLKSGMEEVRSTLREIKPSYNELGINKVRLILEDKIKNTRFNYFITTEGNLDIINIEQWEVIIECIKETSTNTIKYSKGDKIRISIEVFNKIIKIEIKDNGVGEKNIKKGMGLKHIEESLLRINGNLILDGSNGFTTIIILKVKGEKNED